MQNLKEHMIAAMWILWHLKGNPGQDILMRSDTDLGVFAFCDSNWGACPSTRRWLDIISGSLVSWKITKETIVSHSSTEVECRAMAIFTSKPVLLLSFLGCMRVFIKLPIDFVCLVITKQPYIVKNHVFHERNWNRLSFHSGASAQENRSHTTYHPNIKL